MPKSLARLSHFLMGVREELKQVAWPTREEIAGSVLVVVVGVALLATFISACDVVLSAVARIVLR